MGTSLAEMKIYISVDIEGVAGITHWDEAEKGHADWAGIPRNHDPRSHCRH